MNAPRTTPTRLWFGTAGLAFAAYPALRPWGPEAGTEGALQLGSAAWLAAHVLGMVGFVALALALRSAAARPSWPWSGRPVREAETRAWVAVALLLPYYGAETYGLHAVGRHATSLDQPGLLAIADSFRYHPVAVTTFGLGLLVLALVGGRLAHGAWRAGGRVRAGALVAGVALATYLPQFFAPPEVRVAHGLALGLGLLLVAVGTRRAGGAAAQTAATSTPSSSAATTSTDVANVSPRISPS